MNRLETIVADTREQVAPLVAAAQVMRSQAMAAPGRAHYFYARLRSVQAAGKPILIAEYKRRSPSNAAIGLEVSLKTQLRHYVEADAAAISILTNERFFGGSLKDLQEARSLVPDGGPALLRKDFIVDPVQLYQARMAGADAVLLIAAILTADQLASLVTETHALGMGALVELHHPEELAKIHGLNLPVVGINNRDLTDFSLRLNRANLLAHQLPNDAIRIAESGIESPMSYRIATHNAHGALIGTALMQQPERITELQQPIAYTLKACGIREATHLSLPADLLGVNFSPHSKRRIDPQVLAQTGLPSHAVAVFYGNPPQEVAEILARHPFRWVQRYADDVTPEELGKHTQHTLLALRPGSDLTAQAHRFAYHTDLFILDGSQPGSGCSDTVIPHDFPYPFLLAGGIRPENLDRVRQHPACIGVDVASGIETNGQVDPHRIHALRMGLLRQTSNPRPTA